MYVKHQAFLPADISASWRVASGDGGWADDQGIQLVKLCDAVCSFAKTGKSYVPHLVFECQTCNLRDRKGCCLVCSVKCHRNHAVSYLRFSQRFFCDCGCEGCAATKPGVLATSTPQAWPWFTDVCRVLRVIDALQSRSPFPVEFRTMITAKLALKQGPDVTSAGYTENPFDALLFGNESFSATMDDQLMAWMASANAEWMHQFAVQNSPVAFVWRTDWVDSSTPLTLFHFPHAHTALSKLNPTSVAIASPNYISCLDADGSLWASVDNSIAVLVKLIDSATEKIIKIACCGQHRLAVSELGHIYQWVNDDWAGKQQLSVANVCFKDVACGLNHFAAIDSTSRLYTWGQGEHGKLGHGNEADLPSPTLVTAFADHPVLSVSCGLAHTIALSDDGAFVWCFGNGSDGQLGSRTAGSNVPKRVEHLDGMAIARVYAGDRFCAALASGGEVFTWVSDV
jgi:hypothetical protein